MDVHEKLMAMAKRRGLVYPSYEIYGGEAGFYDYGPIGTLLKNNIENVWRYFYLMREKFMEISTPVITPYNVLKASGHVDKFIDEIATCSKCGASFKVEELKDGKCPLCGGEVERGELNLMFETRIGAKKQEKAFLRPETAQGIFVNFPLLQHFARRKLPFGVVQIGKGFRNEVSPRQGVLRLREFSMAEAEIFFHPDKKTHPDFDKIKERRLKLLPEGFEKEEEFTIERAIKEGILQNEAMAYYIALTHEFLVSIGIKENKIRFRQHEKDELAHYANDCWDAEIFMQRFGWIECVGIADRSAYDLKAHMKATGVNMMLTDESKRIKKKILKPRLDLIGREFRKNAPAVIEAIKNAEAGDRVSLKIDGDEIVIDEKFYEVEEVEEYEKFIPHVIEPSYGIDRILYAVLEHNYREIEKEGEKYEILSLPASIAPIKAGVFPLVAKDGLPEIAMEIDERLRRNGIMSFYDDKGSIGRRYARMDEIGTPFCITVDYQSLEDRTVTVRNRDTTEQERVEIEKIVEWLSEKI